MSSWRPRAAGAGGWKTIPQGCATSVWAGVVAAADGIGGQYCENCHVGRKIHRSGGGRGSARVCARSSQRRSSLEEKRRDGRRVLLVSSSNACVGLSACFRADSPEPIVACCSVVHRRSAIRLPIKKKSFMISARLYPLGDFDALTLALTQPPSFRRANGFPTSLLITPCSSLVPTLTGEHIVGAEFRTFTILPDHHFRRFDNRVDKIPLGVAEEPTL